MPEIPIHGTPEQALAFVKAFVKMQATMGSVPKEAEGQIGTSRKFKYADFESVVTYCRPFFKDHGFAHLELCGAANGEATVTAILVHEAGGLVQSHFSWPAKGHQEIGQGQTYFRRYGLSGLAGLSSGDDTDAEGLQPPQQAQKARQEPAKQETKAQPSGDKERAKKGADAIQAHLRKVSGGNAKTFADYMSQASAYAQDAHADTVLSLVAKGEDKKVEDVYRWAVKHIGVDSPEDDFLGNMSPEAG